MQTNIRQNAIAYLSKRKIIITKFLVVSGSAVLLNLGLLFVLVNYLGFHDTFGQNIANVISMELSIVYNYVLSRAITWNDRSKETGRGLFFQILKFHATIGVTILLRIALFPLLQHLGLFYLLNAAIGIVLSALINFVVYDSIVFKEKGGENV